MKKAKPAAREECQAMTADTLPEALERVYDQALNAAYSGKEESFDERFTPAHRAALLAVYRAGQEAQRLEDWKAVNALIRPGNLGGNGCDQTAQRNGIILAANTLFPPLPEPPQEDG